jgi:flagellar motor switch protein FliN/FliY
MANDDSDFGSLPSGRGLENMSFVMDVPVDVTVEIGRKKMRIAELLKLGPASILELDKIVGEPLDVYVNNRRIARGEVVQVGENYGVRLTEISHEETKGLGG